MKQLSPTQTTILDLLGDGLCHSGNELGQNLGISRSAIWKQINQLMEIGVPIIRMAQQGYKLPGALILLDQKLIAQQLTQKGFNKPYRLHLFTSINSTNLYLKSIGYEQSKLLELCCAELQTQGKGRFGRHWHSPFGENIYFSSRWNFNCDISKLSGLSLVTSLAVLASLPAPTEVQVKWPNDLMWQDRKLCGSLIEISAESNGNAQVIIGIGLNVNSDTKLFPLPDKPWCSLLDIFNRPFDRNLLLADLINNLSQYLQIFLENGLTPFLEEWKQKDYLFGKRINVSQSLTTFSGVARGITDAGQLVLEDDEGAMHMLTSGDTSIR